jgi:hypothetical protein
MIEGSQDILGSVKSEQKIPVRVPADAGTVLRACKPRLAMELPSLLP